MKIAGYRQLSELDIANINAIKEMEERCLRMHDGLDGVMGLDKRALAVARTQLQGAFMWYTRAIAIPNRVELGEEEESFDFNPQQMGG